MSSLNNLISNLIEQPLLCGVLVLILIATFYFQIKRQGLKRVAIIYSIIFSVLLGFYLFSGDSNLSPESSRLDRLENRILESGSIYDDTNYSDEEELNLLSGRNIGIAFISLVLGLLLYRSNPEKFNIKNLFKKSSDWIRPQRSTTNELGSSDLATAEQIKRWLTKGK